MTVEANGGNASFDLAEALFFRADYEGARRICVEGARQNDVGCARLLGWIYLRGYGCEADRDLALKWFSQAATVDAEAMFGTGVAHYENKDYNQAIAKFESARQMGYVPATRWLAVMYQLGLGVQPSLDIAEHLYLDAARKGNMPAYLQHSLLLLHGRRGLAGRVRALPRLAYFLFESFRIALRDKHSQRLQ